MNERITTKIYNEILIFIGLSVVNIIFAAIALGIGISFIINHLFYLIESGTFINISLGYIFAGFGLAFIGFWWILPSVLVMDFNTDIQFKFSKKKEELTNEKITSLIVKMISYYRENNKNIKRMIFISRAGGIFFIINGLISTIDFILKLDPHFQLSNHLIQICAIILIISWGILSFFIPRFISKYANFWEYRIKKSQEAEEIIRKHLESN